MSKGLLKRLSGLRRNSRKSVQEKTVTPIWELQDQFITSQFDRLDNPKYFQLDFSCPDLDSFFLSLTSKRLIKDNKKMINLFYERMINCQFPTKSPLYTRLKWLIYHHEMISKLKNHSPLFPYILKAFQYYIQFFDEMSEKYGPYEKYLMKLLVRPYIQYLSKLCFLKLAPDEDNDVQNAVKIQSLSNQWQNAQIESSTEQTQSEKTKQSLFLKLSKIKDNCSKQKHQQDQHPTNKSKQTWIDNKGEDNTNKDKQIVLSVKMAKWYQIYNLILTTLQIFNSPLQEVNNFFRQEFKYLTKMSTFIINDLKSYYFRLKCDYTSLKQLDVNLIEIDQLSNKLKDFQKNNEPLELQKINVDYSKDEMEDFLSSPLKNIISDSPVQEKKNRQPFAPINFSLV